VAQAGETDGGAKVALAVFIASVAYTGYAPIAPGTFGSAAALVVYVALRLLDLTRFEGPLIVATFIVGVWAASETARHLGRTDPGVVVIDEVVGMLMTVAFLHVSVTGAIAGFFLFRLFDIVKPFPAAQSERLPGGMGIMTDDVFAGLYAQLVLRGLAWAIPGWILQS
jgi:phosphatidylglycerophosphatase A